MTFAVIHRSTQIPWQVKRALFFAEGLHKRGIPYRITDERVRQDKGFPILLGTTLWRSIEHDGEYLLVDRCSFGDTEKFVSLVWNGHGRRGDHKVPDNYNASRWELHRVPLLPFHAANKRVLCGQTESYCGRDLFDWYQSNNATHFRPHPAGDQNCRGLPICKSFDDAELITLNSSVAIQGLINGCPVEVHDEGGMAFDVESTDEARLNLMHYLAWTQWSDDEIKEGLFWDYHL